MNDVIKFLKENPVQFLATIGIDDKPKVRPFQFMIEEEGKLYFCTSNKKSVYKELSKTPYVEICCASAEFAWLRLNGKVKFDKDLAIKEKVINSSELVKSIYKTADNPDFEIFYLTDGNATIADFSGNPPQEYEL